MYLDIPIHDKGKIRNILKSFEMFSPNLGKILDFPTDLKVYILFKSVTPSSYLDIEKNQFLPVHYIGLGLNLLYRSCELDSSQDKKDSYTQLNI